MSLAERTREAVRGHPFLYQALRAGVVNYTAAARFLDLGADDDDAAGPSSGDPSVAEAPEEAVVAALRRYAADLPAYERPGTGTPVSMQSGLGRGDPDEALLVVGDTALAEGAGTLTGLLASGDVSADSLAHALGRLAAADIAVEAAGVGDGALVVVVERRSGADALRVVEDALAD